MVMIGEENSLWANRKCIIICCAVSAANLQYGLDTSIVGGLQGTTRLIHVMLLLILRFASYAWVSESVRTS